MTEVKSEVKKVKMKVRALTDGYFNHRRTKEGTVFMLKDAEVEFSKEWMEEIVEEKKEKKPSGKQQELIKD